MELFVSTFVNKIDKKGRVSLPSIFRSALPKNHSNEIILPDYWDPLVDESTISVQLTPIGTWQQLFVKEVSNNKVVVQNRLDGHSINCYYVVQGERKDIPKIELEL